MTKTLKELRKEYKLTTGRSAKGLTREQMEQDIQASVEREERRHEAEKAREAADQARKDRAAQRTEESLRALSYSNDPEGLHRYVRNAFQQIDSFADVKADFLIKVEQDPMHALSWSQSFFKATAKHQVAHEIIQAVLWGLTVEELRDFIVKHLARRATDGHSTSTTSNLCEKMTAEAWAFFLEAW